MPFLSLTRNVLTCFSLLIIVLLFQGCGNKSGSSQTDSDLICVRAGDKYGYIDRDGKFVINPQFEFALPFVEDLALVQIEGNSHKYGYINKKGKFVINANYEEATFFSEGLACVVMEGGAPTFIDNKGIQ